jgi:uncharacterized protein (UPF0254 family)
MNIQFDDHKLQQVVFDNEVVRRLRKRAVSVHNIKKDEAKKMKPSKETLAASSAHPQGTNEKVMLDSDKPRENKKRKMLVSETNDQITHPCFKKGKKKISKSSNDSKTWKTKTRTSGKKGLFASNPNTQQKMEETKKSIPNNNEPFNQIVMEPRRKEPTTLALNPNLQQKMEETKIYIRNHDERIKQVMVESIRNNNEPFNQIMLKSRRKEPTMLASDPNLKQKMEGMKIYIHNQDKGIKQVMVESIRNNNEPFNQIMLESRRKERTTLASNPNLQQKLEETKIYIHNKDERIKQVMVESIRNNNEPFNQIMLKSRRKQRTMLACNPNLKQKMEEMKIYIHNQDERIKQVMVESICNNNEPFNQIMLESRRKERTTLASNPNLQQKLEETKIYIHNKDECIKQVMVESIRNNNEPFNQIMLKSR